MSANRHTFAAKVEVGSVDLYAHGMRTTADELLTDLIADDDVWTRGAPIPLSELPPLGTESYSSLIPGVTLRVVRGVARQAQ